MKLRTRIVATLGAAVLAFVGSAVPAAYADPPGDDDVTEQTCKDLYTPGVDGWSEQINTKDDPETVTVTAKDGYLIDKVCVKAGSAKQGDGPETKEYPGGELEVTFGHSSTKDVSHYMVHQVPFNWDWQYAAPTCTALSVDYPANLPDDQAKDVKVTIVNLGGPGETTLLWTAGTDQVFSGSTTFTFADHADWPGWTYYKVTWVQVAGTNYHWEVGLTCGQPPEDPEPVYICVWDAEKDTYKQVEVAEVGEGQIAWGDGSECTPPLVELCFKTGPGSFEKIEVREDGVYPYDVQDAAKCAPPVYICEWDEIKDKPVQTEVAEVGQGQIEWGDGSECTPPLVELCIQTNDGYSMMTVREDGTYAGPVVADSYCDPPETFEVCSPLKVNGTIVGWEMVEKTAAELDTWPYYDWDESRPNNGCEVDVYVCWKITTDPVPLGPGGLPAVDERIFDPKQEFVLMGDSWGSLDSCWDYVEECDTTTWFQLDHYELYNYSGSALLERLMEEGLGHGEDAPIMKAYKFRSAVGDECEPPTVDICVWNAETQTASSETVLASEQGERPTYVDGSECTPTVSICVWTGETMKVTIPVTQYNEETDILWVDGSECAPPPPVVNSYCEVVDGAATQVFYQEGKQPRGAIPWTDGSECAPSLAGTFVGSLCTGDVPYIDYDVVLNDPSGSVDPSALPSLTFVNPNGDDHRIPLTSFSGRMLWPGASVDPVTGEATGWPGFRLNPATGEHEPVGDDNFGWTREGVEVIVEVNPSTTVVAEYPPATSACYGPPEEIDIVLGAPPLDTPTEAPAATAVVAEATYTG